MSKFNEFNANESMQILKPHVLALDPNFRTVHDIVSIKIDKTETMELLLVETANGFGINVFHVSAKARKLVKHIDTEHNELGAASSLYLDYINALYDFDVVS